MIKKEIFFTVYLSMLLLVSQLFGYVSFFIAAPLFIFAYVYKFIYRDISYLYIIFIIGLIAGYINLYEGMYYFYIRDAFYFIQAPLFILLGGYLGYLYKNEKLLIQLIVLTTFIVTVYKLSGLLFNPLLILNIGLEARYTADLWNSMAIITVLVLWSAKKSKLQVFNEHYDNIILYASLVSVVISFSRTNYAVVLIVYFLPLIEKYKWLKKLFILISFFIVFVMFGGALFQNEVGMQGFTFLDKTLNSLSEVTVREYNNIYDISHNWRGYEAYLGLEKFYSGDFLQLFFGQGFGAVVRTPYWIFNGEKLNDIPMFHNGYFTILLKTGYLGLFVFFLFLYRLLTKTSNITSGNNYNLFLTRILQGCVFVVLLQTFVIHGVFATSPPVVTLILIGVVLGVARKHSTGKIY